MRLWNNKLPIREKWLEKNFLKNHLTNAVHVLYAKNKKIYPAYVSKQNSKHEKQLIFLMIPTGEGWNYVAVFFGFSRL